LDRNTAAQDICERFGASEEVNKKRGEKNKINTHKKTKNPTTQDREKRKDNLQSVPIKEKGVWVMKKQRKCLTSYL